MKMKGLGYVLSCQKYRKLINSREEGSNKSTCRVKVIEILEIDPSVQYYVLL